MCTNYRTIGWVQDYLIFMYPIFLPMSLVRIDIEELSHGRAFKRHGLESRGMFVTLII